MRVQPDAESRDPDSQFTMQGSEDSEEETSQEEPPVPMWNDLSIVERVGLNSVEMSEEALEAAFSQISLAFCCDQYTLKQRLQAEEHARNLAEENIQLELTRGRETLEALKALCLDSKRNKILQKLELCLDILGGTVERISSTAEVLGAVHQEARVSRAVELMVAHVENLKKRHDRDMAELEETKRLIQHGSHRSLIEPGDFPDMEESEPKKKDRKNSQQYNGRHRVSISVISNQSQRRKRDLKRQVESINKTALTPSLSPTPSTESSCSIMTKEESYSLHDRPPLKPDEAPSDVLGVQPPPEPSPTPNPESLPPSAADVAIGKIQNKNSPLDTLRHRHKSKTTLSKKKADKDKKGAHVYQQFPMDTCGSLLRQRPVAHWLHDCHWALHCIYLLVLLCVLTFTYFLWKLYGRAL
ncbi:lymphoid-restricted membrane protein isoform X2 [Myripristis murdjan]|uniref:lymphoid-restricted membrane protein isoform X2 n=1 Tax=Myripristis murdjan TaxID=586833 RepID=UPI001175E668|nr:lymphoid-restricted membrane protein-like isoform X2 [Myripristis murdjan]